MAVNVCEAVHLMVSGVLGGRVFLCVGSVRLTEEEMCGRGLDKGSALGR